MNANRFDEIDPEINYDFFADHNLNCKYVSLSDFCETLDKENQLSIINYNIRSYNKNVDAFIGGFPPNSLPSVFNFTETRFSPDRVEQIPGYESYHTTRDGDIPSGGISIFVSKGIKSRILNYLSYSNKTIEVCTVELSFADIKVILIGIYWPHSDTIENFSSHLENFLSSSQISGKFCILMGDLNICILRDEPANNNFFKLLFSLHYSPLITKVTRFPIRED